MKTAPTVTRRMRSHTVRVSALYVEMKGKREWPDDASGVLLFLLLGGTGSSRFGTHNQHLAECLCESGWGMLLFERLMCREQQQDAIAEGLRFEVGLLVQRLIGAARWLEHQPEVRGLKVRCAGKGSRGGRFDPADNWPQRVCGLLLLAAGGSNEMGVCLKQEAFEKLNCKNKQHLAPCSTHPFEEPGKQEQVAPINSDRFARHLSLLEERKQDS